MVRVSSTPCVKLCAGVRVAAFSTVMVMTGPSADCSAHNHFTANAAVDPVHPQTRDKIAAGGQRRQYRRTKAGVGIMSNNLTGLLIMETTTNVGSRLTSFFSGITDQPVQCPAAAA